MPYTVKVDWFEALFTVPKSEINEAVASIGEISPSALDEASDFLGLPFTEKSPYREINSRGGYERRYEDGSIAVETAYDSGFAQRARVTMSGHGVDIYADMMNVRTGETLDWNVVLRQVANNPRVTMKRLDVAVDVINEGFPTPKKLYNRVLKGNLISNYQNAMYYADLDIEKGATKGTTLYIGSPRSEQRLRIYDKFEERLAKGYILDDSVKDWKRLELQLRSSKAQSFVNQLSSKKPIPRLTREVLNNDYGFYSTRTAKAIKEGKRSRFDYRKAVFWERLIGKVGRSSLVTHNHKTDLDGHVKWRFKLGKSNYRYLLAMKMLNELQGNTFERNRYAELITKTPESRNGLYTFRKEMRKAQTGIHSDEWRLLVDDLRLFFVSNGETDTLRLNYEEVEQKVRDSIEEDLHRTTKMELLNYA